MSWLSRLQTPFRSCIESSEEIQADLTQDLEMGDIRTPTVDISTVNSNRVAVLRPVTVIEDNEPSVAADISRETDRPVPPAGCPTRSEVPVWQKHEDMSQSIFICLRSNRKTVHAIEVPCSLPTKSERVGFRSRPRDRSKPGLARAKYRASPDWDPKDEPDSKVWQRIRHRVYLDQGSWKRWIPFYGIVKVEEAQIVFENVPQRDGRYRINLYRLEPDTLKQNAEDFRNIMSELIARQRNEAREEDSNYCDGFNHSRGCDGRRELGFGKCLLVEKKEAEQCLQKLSMLHVLVDCLRRPSEADHIAGTLDGMAQESPVHLVTDWAAEPKRCICDALRKQPPFSKCSNHGKAIARPKSDGKDEEFASLSSIYVELGWRTDQLLWDVPVYVLSGVVAMLFIALCTLVYLGRTGEAGTAYTFGSLICGSLTLLWSILRR